MFKFVAMSASSLLHTTYMWCRACVSLFENVFSESTLQVKRTCSDEIIDQGSDLIEILPQLLEPASGTYRRRSGVGVTKGILVVIE